MKSACALMHDVVQGIILYAKMLVVFKLHSDRFVDVMKIINSSNEHVVALGSNTFLSDEDCQSHLVCLQDQSKRTYHSQVLSQSGFQVTTRTKTP